MSHANWELLNRQVLGVIRLTSLKNVAYNIINEKTTYVFINAFIKNVRKTINIKQGIFDSSIS